MLSVGGAGLSNATSYSEAQPLLRSYTLPWEGELQNDSLEESWLEDGAFPPVLSPAVLPCIPSRSLSPAGRW